jgi:hypothetical protein
MYKIHILGTDSDGLSKMMVNVSDVPCLPPWPKPRIFVCPGVKQVKWCPFQIQPHYLILGNPDAVILSVQQRLLKKANKMLKDILLQLDTNAEKLNWKALVASQQMMTMPHSPLALLSSLQSEYMDPKSALSEASMSADEALFLPNYLVKFGKYFNDMHFPPLIFFNNVLFLSPIVPNFSNFVLIKLALA